jgi:hypothetical protein
LHVHRELLVVLEPSRRTPRVGAGPIVRSRNTASFPEMLTTAGTIASVVVTIVSSAQAPQTVISAGTGPAKSCVPFASATTVPRGRERRPASPIDPNGLARDPSPPLAPRRTKTTPVAGSPSGNSPAGHSAPIGAHAAVPAKRACPSAHAALGGAANGTQYVAGPSATSVHSSGHGIIRGASIGGAPSASQGIAGAAGSARAGASASVPASRGGSSPEPSPHAPASIRPVRRRTCTRGTRSV